MAGEHRGSFFDGQRPSRVVHFRTFNRTRMPGLTASRGAGRELNSAAENVSIEYCVFYNKGLVGG